RARAMEQFHARFRAEPLVLDKWFALEASSARDGGVERAQALLKHPDFVPNPNRTRAVLGSLFRENLRAFHRADGGGYRLLAEQVAALDAGNPQLAAKLVEGLLGWKNLVQPYRAFMRDALAGLADRHLSKEVREKVDKGLAP
ncbi:MAG TPA: aminopeptidase N C-terminal domain-containing protein, partial [Nevskiaceae bacterium]|nr:aminopeptidase N C-terminal domain-containing protein [Nevskiaceae bacterium]